jgi:O-antigen/teichoic acid export membrane protein
MIIKNAKLAYTLAAICFLVACGLFIAGWTATGSGVATAGLIIAIDAAAAHGHLSKKNSDDDKSI